MSDLYATKTTYITGNEGDPADNYEVVCDNWRKIFLDLDHEELIKRFTLKADEKIIRISYYNESYVIIRKTGMIFLEHEPARSLTFNTVMAIYGLFYYSKKDAVIKGEFVPYRQVKRAAPFAPAFQKTVVNIIAEKFAGKADELVHSCQALGGIPVKQGDVGYQIKAFDCVPVEVYFWDEDEEFPAQSNILFDAEITDFLHEESVCCIGADLVRRLCEEANCNPDNLLGQDLKRD